jgi:HSP20 family protein
MRTILHRHPAADFRAIEAMMEQIFSTPSAQENVLALPVDITELPNQLTVRAAVPGLNPEHLDIQVDNQVLTIRGEFVAPTFAEGEKLFRRELSYGKFARSVRLPENADVNAIQADFAFGLVTITVPRVEPEKPTPFRISVRNQDVKSFDAPENESAN